MARLTLSRSFRKNAAGSVDYEEYLPYKELRRDEGQASESSSPLLSPRTTRLIIQLPITSPTITLSHDWPCSIYYHGDTQQLLRKKPFFAKEVETDTLGSPPLLEVLKALKPDFWFSAHLHVKFAAVYDHDDGHMRPDISTQVTIAKTQNPDEIAIGDDEDDEAPAPAANPDEITFDDDDDDEGAEAGKEEIVFAPKDTAVELDGASTGEQAGEAREALKVDESADLVEQVRKEEGDGEAFHDLIGSEPTTHAAPTLSAPQGNGDANVTAGPSRPTGRQTKFLALDKVLPGRDFIQVSRPSPNAARCEC